MKRPFRSPLGVWGSAGQGSSFAGKCGVGRGRGRHSRLKLVGSLSFRVGVQGLGFRVWGLGFRV